MEVVQRGADGIRVKVSQVELIMLIDSSRETTEALARLSPDQFESRTGFKEDEMDAFLWALAAIRKETHGELYNEYQTRQIVQSHEGSVVHFSMHEARMIIPMLQETLAALDDWEFDIRTSVTRAAMERFLDEWLDVVAADCDNGFSA